MSQERIQLGREGEERAVAFLKKEGYRILDTNFRCRLGEIDIVALSGQKLLFAEVKTRRSNQYGSPFDAVSPKKQKKLFRLAEYYLLKKQLRDKEPYFAAIAIDLSVSPVCCELIEFTNFS
ncbi:MAG: YraN family protein [Deltaproteobacteria bacterium]|nr:YraN family protein [Deltaproteobacteria bacterium]